MSEQSGQEEGWVWRVKHGVGGVAMVKGDADGPTRHPHREAPGVWEMHCTDGVSVVQVHDNAWPSVVVDLVGFPESQLVGFPESQPAGEGVSDPCVPAHTHRVVLRSGSGVLVNLGKNDVMDVLLRAVDFAVLPGSHFGGFLELGGSVFAVSEIAAVVEIEGSSVFLCNPLAQ